MSISKRITYVAILTALAIILSVAEGMFALIPSVPGGKIGLANVCALIVLCTFDFKTALTLNILRTVIAGLFASNPSSIMYSVPSSVVSVIAMTVFLRLLKDRITEVGISVIGAFFFNLTQIIVSCIILGSTNTFYYLVPLSFISVVSGSVTGLCAHFGIRYLKRER